MPTYWRKPLGNEKLVRTGYGYVPESVLTGLNISSYEYAQDKRSKRRHSKRKSVMNGDAFKPGGHLYHLTAAYAAENEKEKANDK